MKLRDRVAIVAGGSGGIGAAVAEEFGREGAAVAVHYHAAAERAREVVARVDSAGGRALAVAADVTDPAACRALADRVAAEFGRIDILAAFHGAPFRNETWFAPFEGLRPEDFREALEVDLLGSVFLTQAVVPGMRAHRYGRIILAGSTPAITGDKEGISYLVAKAGVLGLTRALAAALGPDNIHVNAIALGAVDTDAMAPLPPAAAEALAREAALGRRGTPREVARKAVFLASEDAEYLTGHTLVVDGGYAMR